MVVVNWGVARLTTATHTQTVGRATEPRRAAQILGEPICNLSRVHHNIIVYRVSVFRARKKTDYDLYDLASAEKKISCLQE